MSEEYNNVYVYSHTLKFCKKDDNGYELLNDDGSVKIFTLPKLNFVIYDYENDGSVTAHIKFSDLEEEARVTKEQVVMFAGDVYRDNKLLDELLETIVEVANGEYEPEQLKEDIFSSDFG